MSALDLQRLITLNLERLAQRGSESVPCWLCLWQLVNRLERQTGVLMIAR